MSIIYRNNGLFEDFGPDYTRVRDFLIRLDDSSFTYGRWDWMITHPMLNCAGLSKIGLWEERGKLVAAVLYDTQLGGAYICAENSYGYLKKDMLDYAADALGENGKFKALIKDTDRDFQQIAWNAGYVATEDKEADAVFCMEQQAMEYVLPDGFSIVSMADRYEPEQYECVLWRGFGHEERGEGPPSVSKEKMEAVDKAMKRPNVDLSLKVAVVSPEGNFAAYCGMWYDNKTKTAVVEPVATDPAFRRMGLGKAAVLEGMKRCAMKGAKRAFVGSSQQFYYSIGFRPYVTSTFWVKP